MLLYITRHGQVKPKNNEYYENTDFPKGDPALTQLGRHQAELLGLRLKDLHFKGDIYSSPYYRTLETAQIIAEITGAAIQPDGHIREIVKADERIMEFSGMTIEQIRQSFPATDNSAVLAYPWWDTKTETSDDVMKRVSTFVEKLIEKDRDALIVAHGASSSAAAQYMLRRFCCNIEELPKSWNCNLTAFKVIPAFEVICLRDISHISADKVSSNAKMLKEG